MFARFWLLVEGESECTLFQECSRILGHDLFSEGVCCIGYQGSAGPETLIKLADQLGIGWHIVADNDNAGNNFVVSAASQLRVRNRADHITQLPQRDIEVYLCVEGLGAAFESNIAPQLIGNVTEPKNTLRYWEQVTKAQSRNKSKPELILQIVGQIEGSAGALMPTLLRSILEAALMRAAEAE